MNTAGRRQRQAKSGFTHMAPLRRPHYKTWDALASQRHQQELIARETRIRMGSKKGKKS